MFGSSLRRGIGSCHCPWSIRFHHRSPGTTAAAAAAFSSSTTIHPIPAQRRQEPCRHYSLSSSSNATDAAGLPRRVCIPGVAGLVQAGETTADESTTTTGMIETVLHQALQEAHLTTSDIDGLIAVPSLREDHFMEAHYQATLLGLFDRSQKGDRNRKGNKPLRCRTLDTGGAEPVSALLEAQRMIQGSEALECVVVVAADSVGSMSSDAFLTKADHIFVKLQQQLQSRQEQTHDLNIVSPAIPHGYSRITEYQMTQWGVTRDQLRMAVCLESMHAALHPTSLQSQKQRRQTQNNMKNHHNIHYTTLEQVQQAPLVTPHISLLECARRADGAACIVLASNRFLMRKGLYKQGIPTIIGGGEASGPLYPPPPPPNNSQHQPNQQHSAGGITEATYQSCHEAMHSAYTSAGHLNASDIDFFGLYDCFPICLVRAIEACGLVEEHGNGGKYLEQQYQRMMTAMQQQEQSNEEGNSSDTTPMDRLLRDKSFFPINTHGGLLCYGAPWEVPAMYNIVEAVHQLRGQARGRQIDNCRRALVYGNGGVLSASAVAILANSI